MANMTWIDHIENGKKAMLTGARRILGALQHLGDKIPRCCRQIRATTLIISRLNYLMPVWSGTTTNHTNHIRKVQTLQNKAARWIRGMRKRTRVKDLMIGCNWMNVREMIELHTTVMIWKMVHLKRPGHLSRKLVTDGELKLEIDTPRLQFTERSLTQRGGLTWNKIPQDLRELRTVSAFKTRLKTWIKDQREQEMEQD